MNDQELANAIKRASPGVASVPDFSEVFTRAEAQQRATRRRRFGVAGGGIAAAAVLIMLNNGPLIEPETNFVQVSDLLETTSWAAPSDVLLPAHTIDIYEDLPTLTVSTTPVEGALL